MKPNNKKSKLTLNKQSIAQLNDWQKAAIRGGDIPPKIPTLPQTSACSAGFSLCNACNAQ